MDLWGCIHLPHLALDVFHHDKELPFVIAERNQVSHANDAALQHGITLGCSLNTAYSLCNPLTLKPRDHYLEQQALEQLALLAYRFTPHIYINPPQQLLLHIKSSLKLFKGFKGFDHALKNALQNEAFAYSVSYFKTAAGASLLAHQYPCSKGSSRTFNDEQLSQCDCTHLDIDTALKKRLVDMGICYLGDFLRLPADSLSRRFGTSTLAYRRQLTHASTHSLTPAYKPFTIPDSYQNRISFTAEQTQVNALLFPLKKALTDFEHYLKTRQLCTKTLELQLIQRQQEQDITLELTTPLCQRDDMFALVKNRLENTVLSHPVMGLRLTSNRFLEHHSITPDLFSEPQGGLPNRHALIDTLASRLGPNALFKLQINADYRPEKSILINRVTGSSPQVKSATTASFRLPANNTPLWMVNPPKPIPKPEGVTAYQQRINTGWWDSQPTERDYFIISHQDGSLHWVFYDIKKQSWFLQGYYH